MMRVALTLALLGLGAPGALATGRQTARAGANPIRKVVTMLEEMQKKVTEEGKQEEELFEKFMCYCKTNKGALQASMEEAQKKSESLRAALDGGVEKKAQTEQDLKDHQAARSDAKDAIAKATALREKEAAEYKALSGDNQANIAAMTKAIGVLQRGSEGSFLQTGAAKALSRFTMEKAELSDDDRELVLSFLSGTQTDGYAPQSGQIIGILKQMLETLQKNDAAATAAEEAAIASTKALVEAKKKEVEALTEQIEEEQLRLGELSVLLATGENDIKASQKSLEADAKFLEELESTCSTKEAEWDEIVKTRNEELAALAEVIKVLNDDDALDVFSKALPAPGTSFLQLQVTAAEMRAQALAAVRAASRPVSARAHMSARPELDLIELALSGKQVGFEKVLKLIDDLVANLHKEQEVDDEKKAYCAAQFDEAEDKHKELERAISDSEAVISEVEGSINSLREEVLALQKGIKQLDKSVADATTQRQKEHAEYEETIAGNKAAKDLLLWAKNRLNKFYNPKLYKPEAAMFLQVAEVSSRRSHHGEKPPPAPEAPGPYNSKREESAGVIAMIDQLMADLDKETQTSEVDEKNAQKAYEKLMEDSSAKRTADSSTITEKESSVAALEESLQAEKDKKASSEGELAATQELLQSLHGECDWLLQYYDVRKQARTGEIESLEKAHAVLNGAGYSLLQVRARATGRRGFLAASA